MDEVKVQVKFTIEDPETGVQFSDAVYYDPEIFTHLTLEDIQRDKDARFASWKQAISAAKDNPTPPEDPVIAIAQIDDQIDVLQTTRDQKVQEVAQTYDLEPEVIESAVDTIQAQPDHETLVDPIDVVANDIAAKAGELDTNLTDEPTTVTNNTDVAQSDTTVD